MHPLDYPVRHSLFADHAGLAVGDALARRYRSDIHHFAAIHEDTTTAMEALAAVVEPGTRLTLMQATEPPTDQAFRVISTRTTVQMLGAGPFEPPAEQGDMVRLGEADADDMMALAELTEPGPFARNTWCMGTFYGIHIDGRLAAMAGMRLQLPDHAEVSGVCTHPDFRGRGLAQRLSQRVTADISARGRRPFLHAWADNHAAIRLYQRMGFEHRNTLCVYVLERC